MHSTDTYKCATYNKAWCQHKLPAFWLITKLLILFNSFQCRSVLIYRYLIYVANSTKADLLGLKNECWLDKSAFKLIAVTTTSLK